MEVEGELQEFHKTTTCFPEMKRAKSMLSQRRYKRHIEGPKDSLSRKMYRETFTAVLSAI